jgi:hypothetical protein
MPSIRRARVGGASGAKLPAQEALPAFEPAPAGVGEKVGTKKCLPSVCLLCVNHADCRLAPEFSGEGDVDLLAFGT